MSDIREIKIIKGYSDGTLKLSPDPLKAKKKDFVNWVIQKESDVTSITEIKKKSGTDIFSIPPHQNGADWTAEIKYNAPDNSEYEYSISWNGKYGHKTYDPKISIEPTTKDDLKVDLILGLATVIVSLFGISWFLSKKKRGK